MAIFKTHKQDIRQIFEFAAGENAFDCIDVQNDTKDFSVLQFLFAPGSFVYRTRLIVDDVKAALLGVEGLRIEFFDADAEKFNVTDNNLLGQHDITFDTQLIVSKNIATINKNTKMLWAETPTNPLLKTTDIAALAKKAHAAGALLAVDNTFATPVFQRPLELGADIVLHSTTKYIGGHSDVVGGALITSNDELAAKFATLQNSVGAVPGPWDCFLTLRGIKTLSVRMQRHDENAKALVSWLEQHEGVARVIYPGFGGMISFVLKGDLDTAVRFVKATTVFTLAESLGGVESLIELPAIMTHASVPPDVRAEIGIDDGLIRLSVGIEHVDDQKADLETAFRAAQG